MALKNHTEFVIQIFQIAVFLIKFGFRSVRLVSGTAVPKIASAGDLRGVACGDGVRDAAVAARVGRQHQAAAAAARGHPQAAHAPAAQGQVNSQS